MRVLLPNPPRKLAPAPGPSVKFESVSPPSQVNNVEVNGGNQANWGAVAGALSGIEIGSRQSTRSNSSGEGSDQSPTNHEIRKQRKRRGKFRNEQLRKETCMTRSTGACIRCQKNKIRCVPGPDLAGWCMNCLALSSRVLRMPCFRARITEAELFRKGPTSDFAWTRRWLSNTSVKEIDTWSSPNTQMIEITQDLGATLKLLCKEYIPLAGDKQHYTWLVESTGTIGTLETTPFAVTDVDFAQTSIGKYVDNNMGLYLEGYLDCDNVIVWETFRIAMSMAGYDGSQMIRRALKLWVASRLIEAPWRICGTETLGMEVCLDMNSPYYGRIPVTPIMDFQIDNIAIYYFLMPLKGKILKELQKKILANRREDWLEIHLTMFILLNNVERQTKHDGWFARRYAMKERFSNYGLIENIFSGAKILLAHFHHVNRGYMPFSLNWGEAPGNSTSSSFTILNENMGGGGAYSRAAHANTGAYSNPKPPLELTADQLKYMRHVTMAARFQEDKLARIKEGGMYEESMFWCSQLFLPGWTPPKTPSPQDDIPFTSFSSLMENAQQQQRQVRERMARAQQPQDVNAYATTL